MLVVHQRVIQFFFKNHSIQLAFIWRILVGTCFFESRLYWEPNWFKIFFYLCLWNIKWKCKSGVITKKSRHYIIQQTKKENYIRGKKTWGNGKTTNSTCMKYMA